MVSMWKNVICDLFLCSGRMYVISNSLCCLVSYLFSILFRTGYLTIISVLFLVYSVFSFWKLAIWLSWHLNNYWAICIIHCSMLMSLLWKPFRKDTAYGHNIRIVINTTLIKRRYLCAFIASFTFWACYISLEHFY